MQIEEATARSLASAVAHRELSPLEIVDHLLGRIDRLGTLLHCFLTVDADDVVRQARRAENALYKGEPLGPLHGVPVTVKDTIDTARLRTTYGSALFEHHVPTRDAVVVERLRDAGAIILGKTATPEFAMFGRTVNRIAPECVNPWDLKRSPAGSSGGAGAALAARLGPAALGTDGGGSIRFPSAFTGVFGLVPGAGRVPKHGNLEADDLGYQMSVIGPMTRDVTDAALLLEVLAGWDRRDPTSSRASLADVRSHLDDGVASMRFGWLPPPPEAERRDDAEHIIGSIASSVLTGAGAIVEEVTFALPDVMGVLGVLGRAGVSPRLLRLARDPATSARLTPYAQGFLGVPAPSRSDELTALSERRRIMAAVDNLFDNVDLLLTPVTSFPAPICSEEPFEMWVPFERYVPMPALVNLTGCTAASVPCGSVGELPLGLMIIGRRGAEATVLRAARAMELATPWVDQRPSMAR